MAEPMTTPDPTPEARDTLGTTEVISRLEILYAKLDSEGWHVRANTVALAIETLKAARLEGMEAERVKLAGILDARALTLRTPGARTATAVAASIVRRGRELTATEKLENFAAYADEGGDADLATAIRQAMEAK